MEKSLVSNAFETFMNEAPEHFIPSNSTEGL